MGRPLRIEYPGAFYHVTSRGNERKAIFKSVRDREKFLEYLESASTRYGARILAYCLMTNHYHLLVVTPEGNLSQIMRHINGAYTNYFNTKRRRAGHLLQGRYTAILVEEDEYAKTLSRYVHLNPVAARMVERPEEYVWSSYIAYAGAAEAPEWLRREDILADFGQDLHEAQARYREFVVAGLTENVPNPFEEVVASTLLGSAGFVEWVKARFLEGHDADRELPALKELAGRPSIEAVQAAVQKAIGENERQARQLALYLCHRLTGRRLKEIGRAFGVGESAVTQASWRVRGKLGADANLAEVVGRVEGTFKVSDV